MLKEHFEKYPGEPYECKKCADIETRTSAKQRNSAARKSSDLRVDYSCIICLSNPKNCAFVPCGHVTCCEPCALNIISQGGKCLRCKKTVDSILKNHAM